MNKKQKKLRLLILSAVLAALCCVSTMTIVVPLPYGYLNLGDIFVLFAVWCVGPIYGGIAAAIGSALADILSGFASYAPATFVIKGLVALISYFVYRLVSKMVKNNRFDFISRLISAFSGEVIMVAGYFLYECLLYGSAAGLMSVFGNSVQGFVCAIGGTLLIFAATRIKPLKNIIDI